jgi:hypothetical protein
MIKETTGDEIKNTCENKANSDKNSKYDQILKSSQPMKP